MMIELCGVYVLLAVVIVAYNEREEANIIMKDNVERHTGGY